MMKNKLKRNTYFQGYKKLKHVKLFEGFVNEQNWTKMESSLDPFQASLWEAVKEKLNQEVVEDDNFEVFYDSSEIELKENQMQFDYWDADDEEDEEEVSEYDILSIFAEKTGDGVKIRKWVQHFVGNGGDDVEEKEHEAKDVIEAATIIAGYLNSWNKNSTPDWSKGRTDMDAEEGDDDSFNADDDEETR